MVSMKHKFSDIELAYDYVSSQPPMTNTAILSRVTGRIYYLSDAYDSDEDVPDDAYDSDGYIEIPHKHDLHLGTPLVRRFIQTHAPELSDDVGRIFSGKGAYSRYKDLLHEKGLLDSWHGYEDTQTKTALKKWCEENNIELTAANPDNAA